MQWIKPLFYIICLFAVYNSSGSPFIFPIQLGADASKVRVSGPGIQSGILATFQSTILVETSGAGPGRLTVRVRGPKGYLTSITINY